MGKSLGNTEKKEGFSVKEWLGLSIFGTITFGGAFLIGRKMIMNHTANKEEDKSFQEGTAESYAKEIKLALHNDGWYGADTVQLRTTFQQIPSQDDFKKVTASYEKMYNASMMVDISGELKTTEYNEMQSIINAKPKKASDTVDMSVKYAGWANRINAALSKTWGWFNEPDTGGIKAVFNEIPTQTDYVNMGTAYLALFHSSLDNDLKNKLSSGELTDATAIINSKPMA